MGGNGLSAGMRRMVETAQGTVSLVVTHHIIETDDFPKSLFDSICYLCWRFAIGNDLKDGAHDVLFLMNKVLMNKGRPVVMKKGHLGSLGCSQGQRRANQGDGKGIIPAHNPQRRSWPHRLHLQSARELPGLLPLGQPSRSTCRWRCRTPAFLLPECKPAR